MNDKVKNLALYNFAALALALFSFFMAALVSDRVFDHLPHLEDEMAYLYQARIFARGDVVIDTPQPQRAFWQPFVVDYGNTGHRFGKYSPGWPLILAGGQLMGQLWVINAFCAALTVALVYRLGREVFNPDVGLIAAALTTFSPMALLLNGTLMGHTSALFTATLFTYAMWRIEQHKKALLWGIIAGIALGLLIINRPLTAVGIALPFVIWSGLRVLLAFFEMPRRKGAKNAKLRNGENEPNFSAPSVSLWFNASFWPTLRPLLALTAIALLISASIPAFNQAAVKDPAFNLYTLVWPYDQVGFGTCCGRSSLPENGGEGHTIVKGVRHSRFDLSLMAADLFGWNIGTVTPEVQNHLQNDSDYWPLRGLSFFILPIGLFFGFRKRWLWAWLAIGLFWLVYPLVTDAPFLKGMIVENIANTPQQLKQAMNYLWAWVIFGAVWLLIPSIGFAIERFGKIKDKRGFTESLWTWLFFVAGSALIFIHLAYWIGSQRYTTRYYFEGLTALALIGALPIAWLARHINRPITYGIFAGILVYSLYTYSTPRIDALYRFNFITPDLAQGVEERRDGDRPVLVIVTGVDNDVRWRSYGSLMALTGPYLNDDIVVAWDYAPGTGVRDQILARFPDRQVIELNAQANTSWFADENPPTSVGQAP